MSHIMEALDDTFIALVGGHSKIWTSAGKFYYKQKAHHNFNKVLDSIY